MWTELTVDVTPPGGTKLAREGHDASILRKENGKWLLARDANTLPPMSRTIDLKSWANDRAGWPDQSVWPDPGRRRPDLLDRTRNGHRIPGSQRCRQDHHHAADPRSGPPTSGTATIDGRTYRELHNPLRTVGALLDAGHVHPNRSARNHLRWIAATHRIGVKRVDEVLDMVGLTTVADRNAGTLSLGMSQRLGIAAALLGDPPVLLFDEPVNGLDPEGIRWVRTLMRTLASDGRTVFVSSHLLAEMANTADALVVGRGRLIASIHVSDFVGRSGADTIRVRSPQLDTLRRVLADAGSRRSPSRWRRTDGARVRPSRSSATWPPATRSPCMS